MATASFSTVSIPTTDAHMQDFVSKFIAAMATFPSLTRVTDQVNQAARTSALNTSYGGQNNLDNTSKTFTGGTVPSGSAGQTIALTGATWGTPLDAVTDLGRYIKWTSSGGTFGGYITAINVGTNTVSIYVPTAVAASTAGTSAGFIGVGVYPASFGNSMLMGYLIYRFNDPLQATAPVFIKIHVGQFAQSSNQHHVIYMEFGSGLDGFGNLTGDTYLKDSFNSDWAYRYSLSGDTAATARMWLLSSDAGRLQIMPNVDGNISLKGFLSITRGIGSDGNMTGEFLHFVTGMGTTIGRQGMLVKGTIQPSITSFGAKEYVLGGIPTSNPTVHNGDTAVCPVQPILGRLRPHAGDLMFGLNTNFPAGGSTIINGRTYYSVGLGVSVGNMTSQNALVRYE